MALFAPGGKNSRHGFWRVWGPAMAWLSHRRGLVCGSLFGASGLLVFWVGALHEFVRWFQGRVPLDHFPSTNITIGAAAVSNGQFGIAHDVLRSAVRTDKVTEIKGFWDAHRGDIYALTLQHASARRKADLTSW
jgi:hypothetical protein